MAGPLRTFTRRTMHARVAQDLEELIVSGQLKPGEPLPSELEMAQQMGISRTVVRDAMRTLAAKGLVIVKHGAGTFVSRPGGEGFLSLLVPILRRRNCTMGDLFDFRVMIEPEIVALATRRSTLKEIDQLWKILQEFPRSLPKPEGAKDMAPRNIDFHLHLMRCAHNPVIDGLIEPITKIILGTQGPLVTSEQFFKQHFPIADAVRRKDPEAARQAMHDHFELHRIQYNMDAIKDQLLGVDL